jgi:hypothetical protein
MGIFAKHSALFSWYIIVQLRSILFGKSFSTPNAPWGADVGLPKNSWRDLRLI